MKCNKCDNELIEYRCGNDIEYICPVCDEPPVTQVENLIECDPNMYTMTILAVKDYDRSMLKKISEICACNVLEAKKILEETGKEFSPVDALEMRSLKHRTDDLGISYKIYPRFNWD